MLIASLLAGFFDSQAVIGLSWQYGSFASNSGMINSENYAYERFS